MRSIRRVNLNDLYALDAILHAPSLTEAGRMISISQPAMSMALRRLRRHFNDDLVIYTGGRQRLTTLALELRDRTRRVLYSADDTFNLTLSFDPATAQRPITIAAPEGIETVFLSHVASAILDAAPGVDVRLLPFDYTSSERMFDSGVDIVIVPEALAGSGLDELPLFDQGLVGMIWDQHALAAGHPSREDYLAARHAAVFDHIERHEFAGMTDDPVLAKRRIVVRTGLYSVLPRLVIGTDLIVTTTNWLAQYHAAMLPLALIDLPVAHRPQTMLAQWQPHRARDPMIRWLVGMLERVVTRIGPARNRWHKND